MGVVLVSVNAVVYVMEVIHGGGVVYLSIRKVVGWVVAWTITVFVEAML